MSIKNKTYWEVCININPICADILCDIIQSNFDCEGIITAEEKYKNLELVSSTEDTLKAYIVADKLNFEEVQSFLNIQKQNLIEKHIFNEDIGSWKATINKQEIVDWSKKWKEHWKPSKISNRIVICPTWEKYEAKGNEIVVNIDPGNAFGTGEHSTTRLCVNAFEKYLTRNGIIGDIGCGSGILGICALKLGAEEVDSVDTDETVIETAQKNAEINNVQAITFQNATSDILPSEKYDFVFANILHNILAEIMGDLKRITKRGGKIVLSGILDGKEPVVLEAIKKNNLKLIEEMRQKEWIAYVVEKEN